MHADHLSAAPYIQEQLGGLIGIGAAITVVQEVFGKVFNEGTEFRRDGSQFDRLFLDGDRYMIGGMEATTRYTLPGHTPACMTHVVGDAAFVGDTLFMLSMSGTARADFPGGGDAHALYRSIRRILALPDATRLFVLPTTAPGGREFRWGKPMVAERTGEQHPCPRRRDRGEFVTLRMAARRDALGAEAHHPVHSGEHAGRRTAAARCQTGDGSPQGTAAGLVAA